jgi:hypothetical protein
MPRNTMTDLRNHLFEEIENLKEKSSPEAIARAMAICNVADRLIGTAKVEVALYAAVGEPMDAGDTEFFRAVRPAAPHQLTARTGGRT